MIFSSFPHGILARLLGNGLLKTTPYSICRGLAQAEPQNWSGAYVEVRVRIGEKSWNEPNASEKSARIKLKN